MEQWWRGMDLKKKGFDIIDLVQRGLQPHNNEGKKIVAPDLAKVLNRYLKLKADNESTEQKFSGIQKSNYKDWCKLHKNRQVDWDGQLVKIDFPDGSDSEIREKYETEKVELERLEPIVKRYTNIPSWEGYERPTKPKDIEFVENLLLNSYFKSEDCLKFELLHKNADCPTSKVIQQKRPSQKAKETAIIMAKEYIDKQETKKKTPVMKDAVQLIQKQLVKGKYKDDTIHDWIKEYFPDESRKKGRPKKK